MTGVWSWGRRLLWLPTLLLGVAITLIHIAIALHDGGAAYNCGVSGVEGAPPPVGDLMGTVDGGLSLFPLGLVCTFGDGAGTFATVVAGDWLRTVIAHSLIALGLIGAGYQFRGELREPLP